MYIVIKINLLFTDKKEAQLFVEEYTEQIISCYNQGKDNVITWAKSFASSIKPASGQRKRKITAKMREMLEENSAENVPVAVSKTPRSADGLSETRKLQAREYFKKKKSKTNCKCV